MLPYVHQHEVCSIRTIAVWIEISGPHDSIFLVHDVCCLLQLWHSLFQIAHLCNDVSLALQDDFLVSFVVILLPFLQIPLLGLEELEHFCVKIYGPFCPLNFFFFGVNYAFLRSWKWQCLKLWWFLVLSVALVNLSPKLSYLPAIFLQISQQIWLED